MRSLFLMFILAACSLIAPTGTTTEQDPVMEPVAEVEYNHKVFGAPCDPFAHLPDDQKVWRAVEINYPRSSGDIVTPRVFDDIVNPTVVQRAMAVYSCTNHMHDQRDALATVMGVGLGHDLSIEGLSYFARTMAYVNLGLDTLASTDGPAYFAAGDVARDTVREYLKNPDNLKEAYQKYKPYLIEGVRKAQAPGPIRAYLDEIAIPYFTQPIPKNVLDAKRELLTVEAQCKSIERSTSKRRDCYNKHEGALMALIATTPDYRVLQWMHRRKAEGGDALVHAWGEILVDFSQSL